MSSKSLRLFRWLLDSAIVEENWSAREWDPRERVKATISKLSASFGCHVGKI